jgi:C-terminal processing protease CtpA/Prc
MPDLIREKADSWQAWWIYFVIAGGLICHAGSEERMKPILKAPVAGLVMLLLAACGDGDSKRGSKFAPSSCKSEVLEIMQDWYLWNDEADQYNKYRNIDLSDFADENALLDFLRYRPNEFDRGFSYITTPEEEQAFFGEGEFVGFGFSLMQINPGEVRFSQVFQDSPAEAAGFQRGYRLVAINGRSIAEIEAAEGLAQALGPARVGFTLTMTVEDTDGDPLPAENLSKALVTITPVPLVTYAQDSGGNDVGYVLFNSFISSANEALRFAFDDLGTTSGGVDRVVIDLRYNGGGLVSVAEVLASLLAGPGRVGDVFNIYRFNSDRAAEYDEAVDFHSEAESLNLDKIVFITSEGSASASELVINGLKPYFSSLDLATVGSPTFGKPVGQFAFDFCNDDYRLRAVTFKSVNAGGDGDYYEGLQVDCQAEDDLSLPLGNANEASFAAALEYMGSDGLSCSTSSAPAFGISRAGGKLRPRPVRGPGLAQQYAGAF